MIEKLPLSPRQQEVLKLLLQGKNSREISDLLGLTYHTVNAHKRRIADKFNIPVPGMAIKLIRMEMLRRRLINQSRQPNQPPRQDLFISGDFKLHSGFDSFFKIDCDALTGNDLATLAKLAITLIPNFNRVIGIPTGGLRFAAALAPWSDPNSPYTLIVDDVLTTGASMLEYLNNPEYYPSIGLVIFNRGVVQPEVQALFEVPAFQGNGLESTRLQNLKMNQRLEVSQTRFQQERLDKQS